ncbi:MAG TPA: hypothetical protein DCR93_10150 [Cytophagales bacterium]|nr:hypothetical protein [Cytophagales bacterium]HAP59835.1 hypothetical protein [Cytophagales bacterium]
MQRKYSLAALCAVVLVVATAAMAPKQRNSFQAHMRIRSAQSGMMNTVEADVFYNLDGRMVSFYTLPQEYTIISNRQGAIQIYNPEAHTVMQQNSLAFSTENSQLYFFLQNRAYDLGLGAMGFTNRNTTYEEGLMVSEWLPPVEMAEQLSQVKMVHEGPNPIYVEYQQPDGSVLKKIYFYKYHAVGNQQFPQAMTQIDYFSDSDSLLTKTEFTDFKLDADVDRDRLNFTVPADAQLITPEEK